MDTETETKKVTLDFSIELQTLPVTIRDTKTGAATQYDLTELSGDRRDEYVKLLNSKMKYDEAQKKNVLVDFTGVKLKLLSLTLVKQGTNVYEAETVIRKWPSKVIDKIYEAALEMNELNKTEEKQDETSKNDSTASESNGSASPSA